MKILAVEDDSVARSVLLKALRGLGHETIGASDGDSAWSLLETEPIKMVVSDWIMPNGDGLDLCRRIRARPDYIYFILLTGRGASEENRRAATDAGVDDFLTKPVDMEELWTRLRVAERILRYTTQVRQLEQMLPICSYCKKIRDDHNYWQQMEAYINERTGSEFSHSVCPDCYQQVVMPEIAKLREALPKNGPKVERTN